MGKRTTVEAQSGRGMSPGTSRRGDMGYALNGLYIEKIETVVKKQ